MTSETEIPDATSTTSFGEPGSPDRRTARNWTDAPRRTVLWMIAAFAAVELSGLISVPVQVALTALAVLVCVNLAVFGYRTNRTAGVVMTTVFTTRLATLTIPASGISDPTRAGLSAVVMISLSYMATWILSWDINSGRMDEGFLLRPPFRSKQFTAILTMLTGFPLGLGAYFILKPDELFVEPLFGITAIAWVIAVGCLALSALGEELIFRRLVAAMVQHTGRSQAPWPAALLYGAAFIGTQNPFMVALAFVAGLVWSWSCERTGTLEPVVVAHVITTVLAFVLLPQIF